MSGTARTAAAEDQADALAFGMNGAGNTQCQHRQRTHDTTEPVSQLHEGPHCITASQLIDINFMHNPRFMVEASEGTNRRIAR